MFIRVCLVFFCGTILFTQCKGQCNETYNRAKNLVEMSAKEIGQKLYTLSKTVTRKDKIVQSFDTLKKDIYEEDGRTLVEDTASKIRILMNNKKQAVKRIAEYAEFLAYKSDNDIDLTNYFYFNADNITNTDYPKPNFTDFVRSSECNWWCTHRGVTPLSYNDFSQNIKKFFNTAPRGGGLSTVCDCDLIPPTYDETYYNWLPLHEKKGFPVKVNTDLSVVKLPRNVYQRDEQVLNGIRWSEPLDFVFKENMDKDPNLKYQYFASPLGFMRHYPAVVWSDEGYHQTYDFRTRSWYTEAMTSPKDIIILVDRSGSITGLKRILLEQIVNNILDTLNDNDFVNIYTFANSSEPLVDCFENTLVQANEENLRLLRESLNVFVTRFVADISLGFEQAFKILENFRNLRKGSQCNQAIMLITEGLDYDYKYHLFREHNRDRNNSVRIFTYQLMTDPTDARHLEWIACSNMGYYANVSGLSEIREKMLNYMNVMSRPVNQRYYQKQTPIWSYLYVDLADRRYSNWLWKKFEGNRQRQVFLDHIKRDFQRQNKNILTSETHVLLQESHAFEDYKILFKKHDYDYMTTVSLPVYGRRENEENLIGVAGVDVPIKLLRDQIPHHKLGVNGYAFILTNNGYVLMHPGHRKEFENIPKPTFNRVDLLEVEILDDESEPRLFSKSIVELRTKMVNQLRGKTVLKIKYAIDEMKRIILSERHYYYTEVGPFSFGIALPDKYGLKIINSSRPIQDAVKNYATGLLKTKYWKIHPDWIYCLDCGGEDPEDNLLKCLKNRITLSKCNTLFSSLLYDAYLTKWFEEEPLTRNYNKTITDYIVSNVFLATHSGLTRWRSFKSDAFSEEDELGFEGFNERETNEYSFEKNPQKTIDEDWYKRAVEENFMNEDMFIYSVPFEISGYETSTKITVTNAIFVEDRRRYKTPVAVVGTQFNLEALRRIFNETTMIPRTKDSCNITCNSSDLICSILDNNAYVIVSDEFESGRFIGNLRPDVMYHLKRDNVYRPTRMFDYQGICQKLPREQEGGGASIFRSFLPNLVQVFRWVLSTITFLLELVLAGPKRYQSIKEDTLAVERLEIKKTFPTPCDQKMWLFTLGTKFRSPKLNQTSMFECPWRYLVERIPNSNLLFLAINKMCNPQGDNVYHNSPTPIEIQYNMSLPCYIAVKNNFTRRSYMECYNSTFRCDELNAKNRTFCGHTWIPWISASSNPNKELRFF